MAMALFRMYADAKEEVYGEEHKESYHIEYGSLESKLENKDKCYLCGNADRSLMGYYRKFDTVGIIGLNEWYVVDLRLKAHDENGNEIDESGSNGMSGGCTQGICFEVDSMASRGMSSATVSSEKEFDATCIQNNLCQEYITKKEYEKCKQVKCIFDNLMENKSGFNEFCIADASPFGFVVLEWFYENAGFDAQTYFQNASDLFDYLMKVWEFGYIYCLKDKYGDDEMSDKELKNVISIEDSERMEAEQVQTKQNEIYRFGLDIE